MKLVVKYIIGTFKFKKFVRKYFKYSKCKDRDDSQLICVVVQPWYCNAVPWAAFF